MARPTKYGPAIHAAIVDALKEGLCKAHAAALGGISAQTLDEWLEAGDEGREPYAALALEVRHAEADYARAKMREINTASAPLPPRKKGEKRGGRGDWKAAAWALEKRFPKIYGSRAAAAEALPPRDDERPRSPWKNTPDAGRSSVQ
jgi:hypothetical protein